MHSINRKIRHARDEDGQQFIRNPRFHHGTMMWVGIGTAGAGLITNLYGANKQSKDNARQNDLNRQQVQESDLNQWKAYLIQRGLNPSGVTQFGQVPTNATPMNTRLPIWANMTFPPQGGAPQGTTQGSVVRRRTPA